MTTQWNDEHLAAYALNEMEASDRAALEAYLQTDEAARHTVDEFRAAAKLATTALSDAANMGLTPEQERVVRVEARSESSVQASENRIRHFPLKRFAFAAALLVLVASVVGTIFAGSLRASRNAYLQMNSFQPYPNAERQVVAGGPVTLRGHTSATPSPAAAPAAEVKDTQQLQSLGYLDKETPGRPGSQLTGMGGGGGGGGMGGYGGGLAAGTEIHDLVLSYNANAATSPEPKEASASQPVNDTESPERYLIKNATLQIETDNVEDANKRLAESVIAAGGYISNLNEQVDNLGRRMITLQARVPADKLDGAVGTIESLGRLVNKQVNTDDVTEEYVDTDARIRNLKKTEERLLQHLSQSMLMENTLKVEQEMTRVREQLERLEGRLRYLAHSVRYSTITVNLVETPKAEPVLPPETFSTGKVFSEAARSLVEFGQGVWVRAIWLGVWSPIWGIILIVAWAVYRRLRRPAK